MGAIKANDIRIGNWVNEKRVVNLIREMEEINIPVTVDISILSEIIRGNTLNKFSPIPLTEEILVKAGFECRKLYDAVYSFQLECKNSEFRIFTVDLREGGIDYHMEYDGNVVVLKYIHQLQNLYYSLTNQELNIQL